MSVPRHPAPTIIGIAERQDFSKVVKMIAVTSAIPIMVGERGRGRIYAKQTVLFPRPLALVQDGRARTARLEGESGSSNGARAAGLISLVMALILPRRSRPYVSSFLYLELLL